MLVPHSAPSSLPLRSRVAGWRLPGPAPAPARFVAQPRHVAARVSLRPGETPEQAQERRLRESQQVEERVHYISSLPEWERQTRSAGGDLVVVEVGSEQVCQTGVDEEPELHWKADVAAALQPCKAIKHTFARIARECTDVHFLAVDADDADAVPLLDTLGIEVLPTVQFWRSGRLLWEHRGVNQLEQNMGEGVLYFGDSAAGGLHASDYVSELHSAADLDAFVGAADDKVLTVLCVAVSNAAPCIHIFPAVLALARSFKGYASFARLMADESAATQAVAASFNVVEVPTFVFMRSGREVARHVGSSRGDLIGRILQLQAEHGVAPPPPPQPQGAVPRRRGVRSR